MTCMRHKLTSSMLGHRGLQSAMEGLCGAGPLVSVHLQVFNDIATGSNQESPTSGEATTDAGTVDALSIVRGPLSCCCASNMLCCIGCLNLL